MSKANFLFFINSYQDLCQTSTPALNQFKWSREINGVPYSSENSQQIQVAASSNSPNLVPYPFSTVLANPNATLNSTNVVAISGSTAGIAIGQLIVGTSIPAGTTVIDIVGQNVTMSNAATGAGTVALSFYKAATFVYLESDQPVSVIYNNGSAAPIAPFEINGTTFPGIYMLNGLIYSLSINNLGVSAANVFLALMG